jgi:redox-sensitive bicupin YhaK (pirin superfamily)
MIKVNREQNRGKGNYGWLKANYSFSFSQYYNPEKMGFKSLRVINEDFIAPGAGFPTHGHKNMEILTVVLKGSLGHTDSLGNIQNLKPGRIQRMYAGNGIKHSEFNASKEE